MTLDEAIRHCEEVADGQTEQGQCPECAMEHRQLAEWLRDYKRLKKQQPCVDTISRREAIKKFTYNHKGRRIPDYDGDNRPVQIDLKTVKEILRDLPSVTPSRKTVHWIEGKYKDTFRIAEQ